MDDLTVGVGSEVIFGKGQQQQQQRMTWHGTAWQQRVIGRTCLPVGRCS
jgi:hypothetical protein